jgi:hypothetical protein
MTFTKENFNEAISHIKRDGIASLLKWIETTDFFTAPASTNFHSNFQGGLLEHSLCVLRFALYNFNLIVKDKPEYEYLRESVIICSLFHDVAKINTYSKTEKWVKDKNNKWVSYEGYEVSDLLPLPHSTKSLYLISRYITLTDAEALAITYHMSSFNPSALIQGMDKFAFDKAFEHPLVKIIATADILATTLEETIDHKLQVK